MRSEFLTAMNIEIRVFWDVNLEDGGRRVLRNVGTYIVNYMTSCARKL
jgi:hypothetical protein